MLQYLHKHDSTMDDLIGAENGVFLSLSEEEEEEKLQTIRRPCSDMTFCKQNPKPKTKREKEKGMPTTNISYSMEFM